jgi:hypothetical protein
MWVGDGHGKAILYNPLVRDPPPLLRRRLLERGAVWCGRTEASCAQQSGVQQDEFQAARKRAQINGLIAVDDTVWAATDTLIRVYQIKKKVLAVA